jgi:hypothetical protein
MKTPEEIEKLADEKYLEKVEDINNSTIRGFIVSAVKGGFVEGYQQCQEDMAKKNTCYHPLPYRLAKSDVNYECTLCGKFI